MQQKHLSGNAFFQEIIKAFDMGYINGAKLSPGDTIPHRQLQNHDYVFRHVLTAANPSQTLAVVTRQGWHFIATGISAEYSGGGVLVPLVKLSHEDTAAPNFSGASYGNPALSPSLFPYLEIRNAYGPGPDGQFLTEPRDFLRDIGEGGVIQSTATLAAGDATTRNVTIIVSGWEIKL